MRESVPQPKRESEKGESMEVFRQKRRGQFHKGLLKRLRCMLGTFGVGIL